MVQQNFWTAVGEKFILSLPATLFVLWFAGCGHTAFFSEQSGPSTTTKVIIKVESEEDILKQIGPQNISEPNVESAGGPDPTIERCIGAAIATAKRFGFHYNASESKQGLVVVFARWKQQPVNLGMAFFRKNFSAHIYIDSMYRTTGKVMVERGGQTIEQVYHSALRKELDNQGIVVYAVVYTGKGGLTDNTKDSSGFRGGTLWPDPPGTGLDHICGNRCAEERKNAIYPPPVHPDRLPIQ
jgi:hypothetical protein